MPLVWELKYGPDDRLGPGPRLRRQHGYNTPDDWYEAVVFELVQETTVWLDVGCGRSVFPHNRAAAKLLAERCQQLVGLDPSDNIHDNDIVHERAQCRLDDYGAEHQFSLITLRMVAEHIADPEGAIAALSRLTTPGGRVVIFTVARWAPVTILSALTPFWFHVVAKRLVWGTSERHSFPTTYLMNTRGELRRLFEAGGFVEESFHRLDDCRIFQQSLLLNRIELTVRALLRGIGLKYPEACIIGIYRFTH